MLDKTELFLRLVFSYVVGNSDMHLKNLSLIETEEGSQTYVLSAAYDLLPVNVIMPEDKEQFALTMNGKKTDLSKEDFLAYAQSCGISGKAADNMINLIIRSKDKFLTLCDDSLLPKHLRESMKKMIIVRIENLR